MTTLTQTQTPVIHPAHEPVPEPHIDNDLQKACDEINSLVKDPNKVCLIRSMNTPCSEARDRRGSYSLLLHPRYYSDREYRVADGRIRPFFMLDGEERRGLPVAQLLIINKTTLFVAVDVEHLYTLNECESGENCKTCSSNPKGGVI